LARNKGQKIHLGIIYSLIPKFVYNIAGMSPRDLAAEIKKHIPAFKISYQPDRRDTIAKSWPANIKGILLPKAEPILQEFPDKA
jgi:hypothetical protein